MTFTLNVLDKALARFLEHDLILIYREETSLDKLRSAAQTLLSYWPVLSGRLNAKVRFVISPFDLVNRILTVE